MQYAYVALMAILVSAIGVTPVIVGFYYFVNKIDKEETVRKNQLAVWMSICGIIPVVMLISGLTVIGRL